MSLRVLNRLPARSSFLSRPLTVLQAKSSPRNYATTTQGDTPNASNVASPQPSQSVNADDAANKSSRATDSTPVTDSASVQSPIHSDNLQSTGDKSPDADPVKQDPRAPAEEKRKHVEKQGERALGAEDRK